MISFLPKLGDRNFILSFVVPALLFTVTITAFFLGWPYAIAILQSGPEKPVGVALNIFLASYMLAIMLNVWNYWIYKGFEGYLPPLSWLNGCRAKYRRRVAFINSELKRLHTKFQQNKAAGVRNSDEDYSRYTDLYSELDVLPLNPEDALPTSFGNAIKSFENYPNDVYGVDSVGLWFRLLTVVPKRYLAALSDIRSQIDFLLNISLLSAIVAVFGLFFFIIGSRVNNVSVLSLLWCFGPGVAAWFSYRVAVSLVPIWGDLVKTGFDCYLKDLAEKLGFELPNTTEKRRQFWDDFGQQAVYRRKPDGTSYFNVEDWISTATQEKKNPNNS